jgi:hypothetical protein
MLEPIFRLLADNRFDYNIFHIIGIALLTILIPVAIAIFDREKYSMLDKYVILDYIVGSKWLLMFIGFIFIPLMIWSLSPGWLRLIELAFWIVGIMVLIKILAKSYKWLKGNRSILRIEYLRDLKDEADIVEVWRSVWQSEDLDPQTEEKYFELFSSFVENDLRK